MTDVDAARRSAIEDRLDHALSLYAASGGRMRRLYHALGVVTIVAAALVPAWALAPALLSVKAEVASALAGIFGIVATLARSIEALYATRDSWARMAAARQQLENERMLFTACSGVYSSTTDAIATYGERVANIIGAEFGAWALATTQSASPLRDAKS